MVGGVVIGVARGKENTLVHVQGTGSEKNDTCSVRCVERRIADGSPVAIRPGDKIWWQCGEVMWTPQEHHGSSGVGCGRLFDIRLRKIGYSH